jgi:hypothetical protein
MKENRTIALAAERRKGVEVGSQSISYCKGVTMCEELAEKLTGSSFGKFVVHHFPTTFKTSVNPEGKIFLQDGDPSQNSAAAMAAVCEIGATRMSIPARSPHINPIENLFHIIKKKLQADAIRENITRESYGEFTSTVKRTLEEANPLIIDRIINTMNKQFDLTSSMKLLQFLFTLFRYWTKSFVFA